MPLERGRREGGGTAILFSADPLTLRVTRSDGRSFCRMDGRTVRQKGLADAAGPTGGPKGTEGGQGSQQEARDA